MITAEQWQRSMEHRVETRQFIASESGQAFIELLYRMGSAPMTISAQHTAEMELGRREGFHECLRLIEGAALLPEGPIEQVEDDFLSPQSEPQEPS